MPLVVRPGPGSVSVFAGPRDHAEMRRATSERGRSKETQLGLRAGGWFARRGRHPGRFDTDDTGVIGRRVLPLVGMECPVRDR